MDLGFIVDVVLDVRERVAFAKSVPLFVFVVALSCIFNIVYLIFI